MTTKFDEKRREYADSPEMLALIDRDERREANYPKVTPPCPPWCRFAETYPTLEHGYDSVLTDDETTFTRIHASGSGDAHLAQSEFNRGGTVSFGDPYIYTDDEEMTSAQARAFAAELLNSADMLDEITAASE
jgi:hypothetical protein